MTFRNKKILIISPQEWDHIKVSKHHYALELAKRGNEVYFLNPPSKTYEYLSFRKTKITDQLSLIENSLFFPYQLKFHADWLFKKLLRLHVKRILNFIGQVDIVWSFSSYYTNLRAFDAKTTIFHPVDRIKEKDFLTPGDSADYLFGVTEDIVNSFNHPKKQLINHGLSSLFFKEEYGSYQLDENNINVCYCGNLNAPTMDRKLILNLVKENANVNFHFVGPYSESEEIAGEFVTELKNSNNVKLSGKLLPEEVADEYAKMDAFILCYDKTSSFAQNRNKSGNSHKILEYLSTGRVLISSNIGFYENNDGLIEMLKGDANEGYGDLFKRVVQNLAHYNSENNIKKRLQFARENSYQKRIEEIEQFIVQN